MSETIGAIQREHLVENSRKVGAMMLSRLVQLKEKYEFIGDVRGKGLLIGVELVRDLETKELLGKKVTELIFAECLKRGLVTMGYFPKIRINPCARDHRGAGRGRASRSSMKCSRTSATTLTGATRKREIFFRWPIRMATRRCSSISAARWSS